MTSEAIYTCVQVTYKLIWNGANPFEYNAYHLGLVTVHTDDYPRGYVDIGSNECNLYGQKSWGFGHRTYMDDQQGWGWDSLDLGPTVFEIAVR